MAKERKVAENVEAPIPDCPYCNYDKSKLVLYDDKMKLAVIKDGNRIISFYMKHYPNLLTDIDAPLIWRAEMVAVAEQKRGERQDIFPHMVVDSWQHKFCEIGEQDVG